MIKAVAELAGKPAYNCRAFELLITLDLEIYKAIRRLIIFADMEFAQRHKLLQKVFDWKNYHLSDFAVFDSKKRKLVTRIVPDEERLEHEVELVRVIPEDNEESCIFLKPLEKPRPKMWRRSRIY